MIIDNGSYATTMTHSSIKHLVSIEVAPLRTSTNLSRCRPSYEDDMGSECSMTLLIYLTLDDDRCNGSHATTMAYSLIKQLVPIEIVLLKTLI